MNALASGFADPVAGAQATFRAILDAMAHPGRVLDLPDLPPPPPPLGPAAAAVLLTLIDADTPLWLDGPFAGLRPWIALRCGAAIAAEAERAAFVLTTGLPDLMALDAGSDLAPETGATVIVQLPALGEGDAWSLSGPGVGDAGRLDARGLPADFPRRWRANHARYPRGVDLILCAGRRLAALPRSVAVA